MKLAFVSLLLAASLSLTSAATVPLNDTALSFTPSSSSWTQYASTRALGDSVRSTTAAGASIMIMFQSSEITIIGGSAGAYSIALDGQLQPLPSSTPNLVSHSLFSATGLDPKSSHMIVMTHLGAVGTQLLFNEARVATSDTSAVSQSQVQSATVDSIDASIVALVSSIVAGTTSTTSLVQTSTTGPASTTSLSSSSSTPSPTPTPNPSSSSISTVNLPTLLPSSTSAPDSTSTTSSSPHISSAAIIGISLVSILLAVIIACILYQCFRQRQILHQQSLDLDHEKGPSGFTSEAGFASTTNLLGDSAVESKLSRRSMAWVERSRGHLSWMSVERRDRLSGTKAFYQVPLPSKSQRPKHTTPIPPVPFLPLQLANSNNSPERYPIIQTRPRIDSDAAHRHHSYHNPIHLTPDNLAPFLTIPPRTPPVPSMPISYPAVQVPTPQAQATHHHRRTESINSDFDPRSWAAKERGMPEGVGERVMYAHQDSYYGHVGAMFDTSIRDSIPDSLRSSYYAPSAKRLPGRSL